MTTLEKIIKCKSRIEIDDLVHVCHA